MRGLLRSMSTRERSERLCELNLAEVAPSATEAGYFVNFLAPPKNRRGPMYIGPLPQLW